jgi:alginate O-acetyltransferase complex protein AlgI
VTLHHIAASVVVAVVYGGFLPAKLRGWMLLVLSIAAVYWLSPPLTIRHLDFVLPSLTLVVAVASWWFTRPGDARTDAEDWFALGVVILLVVAMAGTRYLVPALRPTPSRAPAPGFVAVLLLIAAGVFGSLWRIFGQRRSALNVAILLTAGVFVILKTDALVLAASRLMRTATGQSTDLVRVSDVTWLGYSYFAFRLIHMFRDRLTGKLPTLSLREALTYTLFFPSFTAGPIDRAERFITDFRSLYDLPGLEPARFVEGGGRVAIGILKKFVIADSLALLSLNVTNGAHVTSAAGAWLLLYGYTLRLFFDFSGYSDIAIGVGVLFGIRLPENFDRPYLQSSLAAFWQSWHITLSNWVRFYVFAPLSRALMLRSPRLPRPIIVFSAQMATMLTIGLWHGVSWGFVIWGLWHGAGLFAHKLWSDHTRGWYLGLRDMPRIRRLWSVVGVLLTFHFVAMGWVWFALPNTILARDVFLMLFGIAR